MAKDRQSDWSFLRTAPYDSGMFLNRYLREMESLYREGSDPAHDIFNDDTSDEWWERFHAVSELGLMVLEGHTLDEKKLKEINRLLLFAMSFPGFPDGQIYAGEKPDFRIVLPHRQVGFELSDVYVHVPGKAPLQYQEILHDKIVAEALRLYKLSGGPPVSVTFDFVRYSNFRESDIPRLAQELAAIVPAWLAASTEAKFVERHNTKGPWPEWLAWAHGHAPHPWQVDNPRWLAGRGGSVHSSEAFLQSALDRKEKKLADYRTSQCDEFWLLLIVPRLAPSSFMNAPDPAHVFASSFDRAFFFQLHGCKVVELSLAPKIRSSCTTNALVDNGVQ
jgi:hypothetical protein